MWIMHISVEWKYGHWFDNFDQNVDDMELLSHTSSRENLENQLVNAALQNGIDGINVDFEQIPTDVGDHYIQFIRELSVLCRVNNLVLSVDNYVPKGYNTHYHREEQGGYGRLCDHYGI